MIAAISVVLSTVLKAKIKGMYNTVNIKCLWLVFLYSRSNPTKVT